jgi:hypothetical protein
LAGKIKNAVKWGAENIIMPAITIIEDALTDLCGTYTVGADLSVSCMGATYSVQIGVSIDSDGDAVGQLNCS